MDHDGVSVTALMVLVAFAIERGTSGTLFLLSLRKTWRKFIAGSSETREGAEDAQRRYKLIYFCLAGTIALIAVIFSPKLRALHAMGMYAPEPIDIMLTWLVLVAGADRIGELVQSDHGPAAEKSTTPIKVEGTLTLKEDKTKSTAT